jgi:hypothetical protein
MPTTAENKSSATKQLVIESVGREGNYVCACSSIR